MHLDLLLHEQALDELAIALPEPGMVHADTELQRVPQVRVLRAEHSTLLDRPQTLLVMITSSGPRWGNLNTHGCYAR